MLILNIAGGKFSPLKEIRMIPHYFHLSVDTSYFSKKTPEVVEQEIEIWLKNSNRITTNCLLNMDVFEFMDRTYLKFNNIAIYRFLEHVSFTNIAYFIYLVSTVIQPDGLVDVIVPNYEKLAAHIIEEPERLEKQNFGCYNSFEGWNTELTTELLNEPSCPHASIWTPTRVKMFWEAENKFKIINIDPQYSFDGRDIYLRFQAKRI